jgi:glycosyltransferase involved in cell wall biosynthesis
MINFAGKGGSEKYIKNLANFVSNNGEKVFFCYNIKGLLTEQMEGLAVESFQLNMSSPLDIKAALKLKNYCKKNHIDIIHTQFARENYISILAKLFGNRAKIVHTCHINTYNNFFWRVLNRFFTGENHRIIAVCNSVKNLLVNNNYPEKKVDVIFNGIEYREDIEKLDILRKELKLSENTFIFVTLTRFSEEKGIFFLLKAALRLKEENKNFALVIAGDGDLYEQAVQYIKGNSLTEHVFLLGYRNDGDKLLLSADCFINSSASEALSFAILEAMEARLPVIATDVGGNPDIINKNTNRGRLVPYGESDALAEAMEYMMDNPKACEEMSVNGRSAVKDIFNVENSVRKTYEIYKRAQ